jgi:cytochrome P450
LAENVPDLTSPQFATDPYPTYAWLRKHAPVYWHEPARSWLVSRHVDVATAFRDQRLSSARMTVFADRLPAATARSSRSLIRCLASFLGMSDPPDHTRLRRAVSPAFTSTAVERFRGRVESTVDRLLDSIESRSDFDVIKSFAYPLPATTISQFLGLPAEDIDRFKNWTDEIVGFISSTAVEPERARRSAVSLAELEAYLEPLLADRRAAPRDDLITHLVRAQSDGILSAHEAMATCVTALAGGEKTTTNLIGNGLLALLTFPDQLARLRSDPSLLKTAVEELVRFDTPVPRTWRYARETMDIAGTTVRAGDPVLLLVASANRDDSQFTDPDRLDVGRSPNRHLGFGFGPHLCVGAPLARLEAEVAFDRILRRFKRLTLVSGKPITWREDLALAHRGAHSIWASIGARGGRATVSASA